MVNSSRFVKGKGYWKNKTKIYDSDQFLEKFKKFWAENLIENKFNSPGSWWVETKFKIKRFLIKLNNVLVDEKQEEIKNAKLLLEREKFLSTLYPNNNSINRRYFKCKDDLAKKQIADIKERIIHDRASDLVRGDLPTKSFFEKLKKMKSNQEPVEIYKMDGTVESNPINLVKAAKEFFEDKFKPFRSDRRLYEKFLNFLPLMNENDVDLQNLMKRVTLDELWDVIKTFLNNKTPGIDGISIEFYKKCFHVIKYELLDFINYVIFGGHLPRKVNTGVLKLLHKKDDKKDLKNYRPITLMNVDLKIITKIFTLRLKNILPKILHPDQYAQPGKQISQLNCLIRDILEEMENGCIDNFFVQFDFHKAFDSISHDFLFECLEKMNFPRNFVSFLRKIYQNAVSKVMVNGFMSKAFKLCRGSRQGDPLSLYIFIIVLNAFLIYLNLDPQLIPFRSGSNKKFLTHAFADDFNISTGSLSTLLRILNHLEDFRKVSGLKINLEKTHGYFFNRCNVFNIEHLPLLSRNWNVNMVILGIPYGKSDFVKEYWKNLVNDVKLCLQDYDEVYNTFDAKSIITKSLVLPKISYVATVLDIPNEVKKSVETMIFKYIVPKGKTYLSLSDLAQKRKNGGYNIDHTTIHANVFSLIQIFRYVKSKIEGVPLTNEQYFIEYNLGFQLARILNIPVNNRTPHRTTPMRPYANILKFIKDMKISREDLVCGKIKQVYENIIFSQNKNKNFLCNWSRLHYPVLPNYLKTFNYKLCAEILPCKTNFVEFGLDTDSRCNFCQLHPDTVPHIFSNCKKISPIWEFLDVIMKKLNFRFSFITSRRVCDYDLVNRKLKKDEEAIVLYLNTITNHKIWKYSRKIQFEEWVFNMKEFVSSLIKTIESRKRVEELDKIKHCQKIKDIDALSTATKWASLSVR